MLIDSHAHLEAYTPSSQTLLRESSVDDLKSLLARAKRAGVGKIVTIGTSLESSKKAIEIANNFSTSDLGIYATVGLHPNDAKEDVSKLGLLHCFKTLKQISQLTKKVVAIGEAGLDYYFEGNKRQATSDNEKEFQRKLFGEQIKLAIDLKLPLVVHCRNGWEEIFGLLSTVNLEPRTITGVFHSWTGNLADMKRALDLGFYISFSGILTFKNAQEIQAVAKKVPLDRILIETDSPHLAPDPIRGSKNEPKNVRIVADFLANMKRQSVDEIFAQTTNNAKKLFNLL